ncbi:MAG: sulfurtransferase [Acidobacteriaceae bacterium]|nr:sulfurtransferase [Acidobacteriaceae bacterium]
MPEKLEIEPREAHSQLAKGAVLVDVREPEEYAVAAISRSRLIPMQSIPAQLQEIEGLSDGADVFVICHHGVRSLQVVHWLREHGVENCFSVAGGIDRWSQEIDPAVPRY